MAYFAAMILITGGAGFIGGNFVHHWLERHGAQAEPVVVFDKLTYAGNPHTIAGPLKSGQATLIQADIADRDAVRVNIGDGATLAFTWRGDIWSVPVKGGAARRLTQHPANESSPAFSPDGKQLAFTSDREGSRQIYVMPAGGGDPRQLTWHTEGWQVGEWFPEYGGTGCQGV